MWAGTMPVAISEARMSYLVGGLGDGEQQLLHGGLQAGADGGQVLLVLQHRPGQRALQQLLRHLQALVHLRLARPHARVVRCRLAAMATLRRPVYTTAIN